MSDGKIDEAITTTKHENGEKEDETLNNSVSDGEIFDDDEPEEQKAPILNLPRKNPKNFRPRNDNSDSDEAGSNDKTDKTRGITDGELQKLKSRMNGAQMLDKTALEDYRDKIMNELGRKNERKDLDRRNFDQHPKSRFNAPNNFNNNGFRRGQFRGNNRGGGGANRMSFFERNRNNRTRENGMDRPATSDEFRVIGIKKALFFPLNIIKHTKLKPSISYSERPQPKASESRERSTSKTSKSKINVDSKDKEKVSLTKSESKDKDKISPKKNVEKTKVSSESSESKVQVSPKKTPNKVHEQEKNHEIKEHKPKVDSEKTAKFDEVVKKTPEKVEKSPEDQKTLKTEKSFDEQKTVQAEIFPEDQKTLKAEKSSEDQVHQSEKSVKLLEKFMKASKKPEKSVRPSSTLEKSQKISPEKIKIDLKLEKKKSPKLIDKPKVNIFLEDSDEVDEFESSIMEIRSKWSSPERVVEEEQPPRMVSPPVLDQKSFTNIPMMVESPEKSPLLNMTNNIFELSKSATIQKSPTPSPPLKQTKVRNVCSFLSDIASGNMFAGLGLGSGLYDNANSIDGLNLNNYKREDAVASKSECKSRTEEETMEPDTTVLKTNIVGSITPSDDDTDSDESESESSSSDSDDTTSESDESSDDSSDDEIPSFTRGFGRFDASSMPMVTQIKPAVTLPTGSTALPSTPVSRFQPQQNVIKPPELLTHVTKPAFYVPQTVHQVPAIPTPFTVGLGSLSFPIPFKIYSLRDVANCEMLFHSPAQPVVQAIPTPTPTDKSDKDRRDRDRKRSRSRSRSHERDKKRLKDDRRKSPPRSRARQADERKDSRRKDPSPRHNSSHNSRNSHGSRQSPARRQKRSRSRTPPRHRLSPRPRTPPRQKSPPIKARRSSPHRRSVSRSPTKYRRSNSPANRRMRSPSPLSRRSPRRRHSRSPNRNRRGSSPDYRYERRSFSPSFGNKTDSPINYRMDQIRPDSTISDTELERQQQQYLQEEFYLSQWNNPQTSSSPKRPNLDDRIHRMLSDSPTRNPNVSHEYPPDAYPYPVHHDNRNEMFYQDMYQANQHQMPPPHLANPNFNSHPMNHQDGYDFPGEFSSPRNFVNNSNLVDITQQNRDRQRAGSSQAVQVGNVLEIVPNNKIVVETSKEQATKSKALSPSEVKQQAEKRMQAKLKRKVNRERKRAEKQARKEKLRLEIQRYFDAGVTVDHSDDESLISLQVINIVATVEKGILRKCKVPSSREKKVLFSDGILPGETTSEDEANEGNADSLVMKRRRKQYRKTRLVKIVRSQDLNGQKDSEGMSLDSELDNAPPPLPPNDKPPGHLKQPQLKKITVEMFAAFPVNPDPLYYYIQKIQQAKSMYQAQQPPPPQQSARPNDRFHYYKTQPPIVNQSPSYLQQQRSANNSVSSLDPRIRSAEKSFA